MATASSLERQLRVTGQGLSKREIGALMARVAKSALQEAINAGEASPQYTRVVNGRVGASEESVEPPGPIVYLFNTLNEAAVYALAFVEARSPVRSGRFKRAWFVMVNGNPWNVGAKPIPDDAEVIVTNDVPYARRIEVGHMKLSVPPGIVESARQAVQRKFGDSVKAQRRFIELSGGYRVKGRGARAGGPMRYPALVMNTK